MPQNHIVRARSGQIVYFAQLESGAIKIGTTSCGLKGRLPGLKWVYGQHVAVLATMPGGETEEHEIHARFAHLRFGDLEQFRPAKELMEFIGLPALAAADPWSIHPQPEFRQSTFQKLDLKGRTFGRLVVIRETKPGHRRQRRWLCRCECGTVKSVMQTSLIHGMTLSCGCLARESVAARARKHGGCGTPEYYVWCAMKARCTNPNHPMYPDYGGRGITVCPEWLESFAAFIRDVGPRPSADHSLDRERNNEGYWPGNVRWATIDIQNRNTRRNIVIEYDGVSLILKDWAERLHISYKALLGRIKLGWSVDRAFQVVPEPRDVLLVTFKGETKRLSAWAKELGLSYEMLRLRIYNRGWSIEEAFSCRSRSEGRTKKSSERGASRTREYAAWNGIIQRCTNPRNPDYAEYGGRGIRVCDRWSRSFDDFLADIGKRPSPRHALARTDTDGHFEPGNVHWATQAKIQNNRRDNRRITYKGEARTLSQWSKIVGISAQRIGKRLTAGWSVERALETPLKR